MSMELLEQIHAKGLAAAQTHFEALLECMNAVLPDGVKDTIPKALDEVAGLFSASTKEFYLTILHEKPGYETMNAVFEYGAESDAVVWRKHWNLKKFCVMIGGSGLFAVPKEYTATCIEDALVLSKRIFTYREKYIAENLPMPETSTSLTSKPN